MDIKITFDEENNQSLAFDGDKNIGECQFMEGDGSWLIVHTGVREGYEGQGIAKKLVDKVVEEARARGLKMQATCPYAKKLFESRDEYKDVYQG